MLSLEEAKKLQSQIMSLAHTYKTGSYLDRSAVMHAADEIAQRDGYKNGAELQRLIGEQTTRSKIARRESGPKQPSPNAPAANGISTSKSANGNTYKDRYMKLVAAHDTLPPDAVLNDLWGCAYGTLSSLRSEFRRKGYDFAIKDDIWHVTKRPTLPRPPAPAPTPQPELAINGASTRKPALPLDSEDVVILLRSIDQSLRHFHLAVRLQLDDIAKELRQLRAIESQALGITERAWK